MIYLRNIFKQDLRDGKQIAFPKEPSNLFFKFDYNNPDPDRQISFKFKDEDSKSQNFDKNGKIINTRLYAAGSESRIDGELKQFLRDSINAKIDDIIAFKYLTNNEFVFEFIPKGSASYNSYKVILKNNNHEVIIDQLSENQNKTSKDKNVDLSNLKENFADWFINKDGISHNYFKNNFGSSRVKLIEGLSKYEEIYEGEFHKSIFNSYGYNLEELIYELDKNLYIETGGFFDYSEKTSTHMPRAILGKNNYLKFLGELLAKSKVDQIDFNPKSFYENTISAGLVFSDTLINRFIASLCTKPFVILTGLSGSGKTKLAQAFAQWICYKENEGERNEQYCIVPVGADWTNREPLLGYPNALDKNEYVKPENGVLDLIIRASNNENQPHFLILDEMNLSHVERYFADFLSTMESGDEIPLHKISDKDQNAAPFIPQSIKLPKNLFIIGTVNIDETTYMFSPKVLDRANTLEFRLTLEDLEVFIKSSSKLNMNLLKGIGEPMGESFVKIALQETDKNLVKVENDLKIFFTELKKAGAEFGYRTAGEIDRLIFMLGKFGEKGNDLLDIAIMQKLLPKLHGSRNKLTKILPVIGGFCLTEGSDKIRENYLDKFVKNEINESEIVKDENVKFKISFEKICRMYKNAVENGFASYAEA